MREVVALAGEPHVPATPTIVTRHHRLRLLPDMRVLLQTFFDDVDRATRRVDVECFIVNADQPRGSSNRALQVQILRPR